jgi:cobalt transporter subunit CbtB
MNSIVSRVSTQLFLADASTLAVSRYAAAAALLFGALLLFGAGFAGSEVLHNAAHDGRHAFAFPCH